MQKNKTKEMDYSAALNLGKQTVAGNSAQRQNNAQSLRSLFNGFRNTIGSALGVKGISERTMNGMRSLTETMSAAITPVTGIVRGLGLKTSVTNPMPETPQQPAAPRTRAPLHTPKPC